MFSSILRFSFPKSVSNYNRKRMSDTSNFLDRLAALDTNTVSDALDVLNLRGATYGLRPLWNCPKIVGRASTVEVGPRIGTAPTPHPFAPTIDAVSSDDRILVIAGGLEGVSCWGDIIANAAKAKGIRGTVIDGVCRDIDGSVEVQYPLYGRAVTMISGRSRIVSVSAGKPVRVCGGVTVEQDDYVIADACGTVFVPAAHIAIVLTLAEQIHHREGQMVEAVRSGQTVSAVMRDSRFEQLRQETVSAAAAASPLSQENPRKASAEDQELVGLLRGLDSPAVSDALDSLGIAGQAWGIQPLSSSGSSNRRVTVGPAFTVRYVPASDPPGSVGDFLDDVAVGDVVVIDNSSRTDCTVWGDIMTHYAALRGVAGTVIDGVCRDVDLALEEGYPLYTAGRWMRTGKDRVQVGEVNGPVGIGKVRVESRDIVVADSNGVVIIPRSRVREVAELARTISESEAQIRELLTKRGATLAETRRQLGYHTLQRRRG
ncbi:hypothetical protein ASPNIDRAFT_55113 [Aspergillus niger ATCC 1015]|nr:RraA-like protein [Aspergillus niger CBS 101883]EHA21092.1 hypothetical protein ASPNIDRAFT_55113 [Aspergillus niger ATCC 1015]PYH55052.1 RraA-like protein [Aspergillus niger CBS 101883]